MIRAASFYSELCCNTFLDAHILAICSASKKISRIVQNKNTCSNELGPCQETKYWLKDLLQTLNEKYD